jgi:hypothetical protein
MVKEIFGRYVASQVSEEVLKGERAEESQSSFPISATSLPCPNRWSPTRSWIF